MGRMDCLVALVGLERLDQTMDLIHLNSYQTKVFATQFRFNKANDFGILH